MRIRGGISMPLVDSSNHLNIAKAVLPISLLLSKEETEHIYSSSFELAIRYIKQAMVDIDVDIYMKKDSNRIDFSYKNKDGVSLEVGYIKQI